jgi:hypothetical protein
MRDPLAGELTVFLNPDERAGVSVGVSSVSGISSSASGCCEWFERFFPCGLAVCIDFLTVFMRRFDVEGNERCQSTVTEVWYPVRYYAL